jgi:thiamine-monophosphate kinase
MSEADLIARIRALFPRTGDDAAIVGDQAITNDMLVEDVDFTRDVSLQLIARKSLAVNLSDLAAMGAKPQYALVAIGAPEWVDTAALLEEFANAARAHRIEIIGGDLSRAEKLVISITAIGEAKQPLMRSGARAGDRLYVSRPLGGSAAGLELLKRGDENVSYIQREFIDAAIRRHLDPEPEVELGMKLVGIATSCIDVSDGLSTDVHHLCDASGVGAAIDRERIPIFPGLLESGLNVRELVLNGGEEFALLFTSALRESELSAKVGRPVYAIGRITKESGVLLDGQPLEPRGFDHFAVR